MTHGRSGGGGGGEGEGGGGEGTGGCGGAGGEGGWTISGGGGWGVGGVGGGLGATTHSQTSFIPNPGTFTVDSVRVRPSQQLALSQSPPRVTHGVPSLGNDGESG